jgi:NitT/TauT family transport system substrate-binding protein
MIHHPIGRRHFLFGAGALATTALIARPSLVMAQAAHKIRVGSNLAAENAATQQFLTDSPFLKQLALDVELVARNAVNGPLEAMTKDEADMAMTSGFVGWLPAIEKGAEVRMVGATMKLPSLAIFVKADSPIRTSKDLVGKVFGIGPNNGLLHVLMVAYLRKKGIDPAQVKFTNAGSNAQVFEAVLAGKVEAGLSAIAGLGNPKARALDDGKLWVDLPEYTYQPAYASVKAIKDNPEGVARCLAAYAKLFNYMQSGDSKAAYVEARKKAAKEPSTAEAEAVWDFAQKVKPYSADPTGGLTPERVKYLQELNVSMGVQKTVLPFEKVVDTAPGLAAKKLM